MIARLKRVRDRIALIIWLFLLADFLHTASHFPWVCDEDCPWPWGKRVPGLGMIGRDGDA